MKEAFIEFALEIGALKFGEFALKSGRISPYFFNTGQFNTGRALASLGRFYASTLANSGLQYDMLFGPAYKGIPLVTALSIALADKQQLDIPYCFNRKEEKTHGEGGQLVGAPLQGNIVLVDDVITAGTATRESMKLIKTAGAKAVGMIVAVDRQERGNSTRSAIQEIEDEFNIPVYSIISLQDLLDYSTENSTLRGLHESLASYREEYGVE